MYKVFYNQRTVLFTDEVEKIKNIKDYTIHRYKNKRKLKKAIQSFINNEEINSLVVLCKNIDKAIKKYKTLYKNIEAAGGLVLNQHNEILFIYRRDTWDLPKGKIETNEDPKTGAVREVEEECGIKSPSIVRELAITYHTYELNGKNILKKTYWYEMSYNGNESLKPQTEEEITKAVWLKNSEFDQVYKNTFPSIIEVIDRFMNKDQR